MTSNEISGVINDILNFKTGWKTSEFWVAIAPVVVGILSVFGVGVSNDATTHFVVVAWGAVSAVYVAARTFIKSVHSKHAFSITDVLTDLAAVLHTIEGNGNTPPPVVGETVAPQGPHA